MTTTRAAVPETWLSVQEASAMLGVSPATLRRWSAAGEVEAFTTPGGHRRFALTTLRALLPHPSNAPARLSALGESPDRMVRVLRRRARAATTHGGGWLESLDSAAREDLRAYGRAVTTALVEHLDASSREAALAALAAAEAAGAEHGRTAGRHGAPLAELVAVFLHFRASFLAEIAAASVRHGLDSTDAIGLVTRGGEAADRVLAAVVTAYEAVLRPAGVGPTGASGA